MALDARHRSSIYNKFVSLIGEDDANALMSAIPSIEADELVTKQFLRAQLAELENRLLLSSGTIGLRAWLVSGADGLASQHMC